MDKDIVLFIVIILAIIALALTFFYAHKRDKDFIYVHLKTGNKYRIIQECQMKFDGKWMDAVAYISVNTCEMYVREYNDFVTHFKRLSEWKEN